MNRPLNSQRGSVVLVGLILTIALGLVLSSYVAICSNALQLSQREYQSSRALQLAENAMDESLWALSRYSQNSLTGIFNGTMTDVDGATITINWTRDPVTATAKATLTGFTAEGNVTRKAGIRIINYAAPTGVISGWSATTNYNIGSYSSITTVSLGAKTYCCATANIGHAPAPSTATVWNNATSYAANDYVSYGGTLYRCKLAIVVTATAPGKSPENSGYWTPFWTSGQIINTEGVITLVDGAQVRRQLFALTPTAQWLFPNALAAVNGGSITLSNFGGTIDSYDSTTGPYNASSPNFSAVVAGTNVNINAAMVRGYTATAGNTVSSDPTGDILAPGETTGKNSTRMSINMDAPTPEIKEPTSPTPSILYNSGSGVCPISDSSWNPISTLPTGTYQFASDLILKAWGDLTITGNVKLIIPGNFFIGDDAHISNYRASGYYAAFGSGIGNYRLIVSEGASLEIYVRGNFGIYAGGIENQNTGSDKARKVTIYGSTTLSSPVCDIRTDTPFYGTIYAPGTTFTIWKDAYTATGPNVDFYGAIVAKNINFRGGPSLHYDTALRNVSYAGVSPGRSLLLWRDVANPGEPEFYNFVYP